MAWSSEALVAGHEGDGVGDVQAPAAQGGDGRVGERPAVDVVEVGDADGQRTGLLGQAGDRRSPAASRWARCGRTARRPGSRRGRARSPWASTSAHRPPRARRRTASAMFDDAGPTTASTSWSISSSMASMADAALAPSSAATSSTGAPRTPPASLISCTAELGGVDQRRPDHGPVTGLRQQQADAQDVVRRRAPATVVVVAVGADVDVGLTARRRRRRLSAHATTNAAAVAPRPGCPPGHAPRHAAAESRTLRAGNGDDPDHPA